MALINCPECQHQVSKAAASCPNCGRPITPPRRYGRIWEAIGFAIIMLGIGLLIFVEFSAAGMNGHHMAGTIGAWSFLVGFVVFIIGRFM
jgi:hypothetical protein